MDVPEKMTVLKAGAAYVPFIGAMVKQADGNIHTPLVTRLLEIALLGGILYGTLSEKFSNMERKLDSVQMVQSSMQKDIVDAKVDIATIKGAIK